MRMKKLRNPLLLLGMTLIAVLWLTSCGDEDYYYEPIVDNWALVEIDGYPVSEPEVCEISLYEDGTGAYGQYNPYPHWSTFPIRWELDYAPGGAEYLYIYPFSGEVWRYIVRLYPMQMELTDLDTGQRLLFNCY